MDGDIHLFTRDVSQAYVQSETPLHSAQYLCDHRTYSTFRLTYFFVLTAHCTAYPRPAFIAFEPTTPTNATSFESMRQHTTRVSCTRDTVCQTIARSLNLLEDSHVFKQTTWQALVLPS
jgi:hypothetical protein